MYTHTLTYTLTHAHAYITHTHVPWGVHMYIYVVCNAYTFLEVPSELCKCISVNSWAAGALLLSEQDLF